MGCEKDGANMIVLDQRFDLVIDSGAIKAHHEKLANLPDIMVSIKESMEMGELWQTCQSRSVIGKADPPQPWLCWLGSRAPGHHSSARH